MIRNSSQLFLLLSLVFCLTASTSVPATAQTLTTLYSFYDSGFNNHTIIPNGLVQGSDGNFYGTTAYGGYYYDVFGYGTVFQITPSGIFTILHAFTPDDGSNPYASLVEGSDGNFYGTTMESGANGCGTVFKITPSGALTTLYSFTDGSDGAFPQAALGEGSDGNFYGTTTGGGAYGDGTVYKLTPTGALTTLHSFDGTDGANSIAGLIEGSDGNFYGTTSYGGANNTGTVFKVTPSDTFTTLHSFSAVNSDNENADGAYPHAALVEGSDGNFYGTTFQGGSGEDGTVFRIAPSGTLTTLDSFTGTGYAGTAVGGLSQAALVEGSDGDLYGTTGGGGPYASGTVFKVTLSGTLTTLYAFGSTDGEDPVGALVLGNDGDIYGTTFFGGANDQGTIFKLTLNPLQILDGNYQFTHVDLSDDNLNASSNIDLTALASASHTCAAAVADGVTKVLLKYTAPTAGTVDFTKISNYSGDKLETLTGYSSPLNVPTELINGANVAFALYVTPDTLPSAMAGKTNPVQFQAAFTPTDGSPAAPVTSTLPLWHAPVILIHGFNSSPATWENSTGVKAAIEAAGIGSGSNTYEISEVNWADTSLGSFAANQLVLLANFGGIGGTLSTYRHMNVAVTQVDVVGHSMGGILTRELAMWPNYSNTGNFHDGYVHRLITIGTPHLGSKFANVGVVITSLMPLGAFAVVALAKTGFPYGQAFLDLQYNSPAIRSITATPIPCFAVTAESNYPTTEPVVSRAYDILSFYSVLDLLGSVTPASVFPGEASDLIAGETSEVGGLPSLYTSIASSTDHIQEPASNAIGTKVAELLLAPVSQFDQNGFPAPATLLPADAEPVAEAEPLVTARKPLAQQVNPFLTITAPNNGQVFQPGATVTVTLTPQSGTTLSTALIIVGLPTAVVGTQSITAAPFTATFTIPTTYVGDLPITVFASDTTSNVCMVTSDCTVATTATLSSLTVSTPATMFSSLTATSQLVVTGMFSDGVSRDITTGATGTSYASSNENVVTVSADGLVSAVGNGSAQITVTNGAGTATVAFTVLINAPEVLSVTPPSSTIGTAVSLSLVGYNLTGTTDVQFYVNGTLDPNITATDVAVDATGSNLTATVTIGANALPGFHTIMITTEAGSSDPLAAPDSAGFAVSSSTPSITGFTPTTGPVGTTVSLTGTGFATTTAVSVHGTPATFTIVSDTSLTVTIPTGATTGTITVTNPAGVGISATPFTVAMPPTITSFTPTSGPVGTVVTITGTNLTGVTRVRFHNASAVTYSANAGGTQITVTVPSGAATGTITVNTPGGQVTSSQTFTVTAAASPPTITGISPTSGTAGTVVTITGTNLTGTTSVTINGVSVAFTVVNGTTITFTIPAGITGGVISITTPGGTVTSGSITFTLLTWNSKDVAAASDGTARMLWTRSDGAAGIWIMSASDTQTAVGPAYGPFPGWSAKAVSVAGDGSSRVLWTNSNGQAGVWSLNAQGTKTTIGPTYGPYTGWTATDIATASNGTSRVLWTNSNGQAGVWTFSAADVETVIGTTYGPYTGWTAKAVGAAGDGTARVLWANTNGMAGIWSFNAADVETVIGKTYGPFTGWSAADLGTSSDGKSNVLWTNTNGQAGVWTFSAANAETTIGTTYGPYPGYTAAALASANDQSRVLWVNSSRAAGLWTFNASDAESIVGSVYGPY